jgi:hypothetical protein
MRYAKHKITGKIIATQSGDEDLQSFKDSGLGYDEADLEIGTATEAQIATWTAATVTDAEKVIINRVKEYPRIQDQLDDIYHNGIDGWKATIKTTKDKYPK